MSDGMLRGLSLCTVNKSMSRYQITGPISHQMKREPNLKLSVCFPTRMLSLKELHTVILRSSSYCSKQALTHASQLQTSGNVRRFADIR